MAAVARVMEIFLDNIFQSNLSEMEAEARRAVPKSRRNSEKHTQLLCSRGKQCPGLSSLNHFFGTVLTLGLLQNNVRKGVTVRGNFRD